ncbi:DNA replication protein DnaD [Lacticaseibacillus chiayiensis]|uniref:DNA replication protein DnaD n=1 Tax=Lacticaseibacillus chiayiensis TaxID=2100821 RepID=A0A4Q1TVG7_9LACO|nr:DnaD domain protein [Lacticaseibacillus chiayiensis]QVI35934.1 DnaD domain protein [Lacticaseibacillus chiayiensis]RXT22591.1 DNA replication protein DnaD [Lacticaseibacillus chiayiensis]RXT58429.1 DNA replication protein DnaD [Lacticaseibacillus chiayiensis]UYN57778.1 DnaD domain protein [Lacticaseibacillus chiayiensis]
MTDLRTYIEAGQFSVSNLLFDHYAALGLTQTEFLTYLFLDQWQSKHHQAPDLKVLATQMNVAPNVIYSAIETLIQKKAMVLESIPDNQGRMRDYYDLSSLLEKVSSRGQANNTAMVQPNTDAQTNVFNQIEIEFGRPLSPIEQEMIRDWLNTDHYLPEVILLALREAVLNSAYSLKYMDRILLNWERRHLKTAQQVQADIKRHQEL